MTRTEFKAELTRLVSSLIPEIGDEYRASDDPADDTTVSCTAN